MSPRRAFPVLVRELVIVAGQAVIDRTLSGLRGRIRGWRAADPTESFPEDVAAAGGGDPFFRNMARRLSRRRRLSGKA